MKHDEQSRVRAASMSIAEADKDVFIEAMGFERAVAFFQEQAEMILAIETYIQFGSGLTASEGC